MRLSTIAGLDWWTGLVDGTSGWSGLDCIILQQNHCNTNSSIELAILAI